MPGDKLRSFLQNIHPSATDAPDSVSRPHHGHHARRFIYHPGVEKGRRIAIQIASAMCAVAASVCLWEIGAYALDYFTARQASEELRDLYYADSPVPTEELTTIAPPPPTATPEPDASATAAPTKAPAQRLSSVTYPHNPFSLVRDRFKTLREVNRDIVGWLRIDNLLDEAVVQRDNTFYLTHDSTGAENTNGAVFLEEGCTMRTRPYTLILYGHNMKTGLMFGSLRNYEHLSFYRANPFVSFDSIYEDGRYVIFSVATVSTLSDNWRFMDFAKLNSSTISWRQEAIHTLLNLSIFGSALDVRPEDQLLLLITCVDNDDDRRIIAARRMREDESEEQLKSVVRGAYVK